MFWQISSSLYVQSAIFVVEIFVVYNKCNRSPEAINYPQLVTVTVQMCPGFVRFALRGVLPVPEEGETDKDGVQVNGYQ